MDEQDVKNAIRLIKDYCGSNETCGTCDDDVKHWCTRYIFTEVFEPTPVEWDIESEEDNEDS